MAAQAQAISSDGKRYMKPCFRLLCHAMSARHLQRCKIAYMKQMAKLIARPCQKPVTDSDRMLM